MTKDEMQRIRENGRHAARRIAELREEQGLSYAALSRRLGGSLNELALRRIERIQRRIDVDELFDLASALGVSIGGIVDGYVVEVGPNAAADYAEYERIEALPEVDREAIWAAIDQEVKRDADQYRKIKALVEGVE